MNTINGSSSSACGNVNDVVGGRKTIESIGTNRGDAVLVSVNDDAVVFSDEVESVPSLESDDEVFSSEEEEESEEEWESDEEEEEDEGKLMCYGFNSCWKLMGLMFCSSTPQRTDT